jgi:predicted heme/steroid binding protein
MGQNTNIGQQTALTVFGNPESSFKLIKNHGQLCKVKQALVCPCVAINRGSPDFNCEQCNGDGYIYTYQRRFLVVDENSRTCQNKLYPFWNPILAVKKVQNVSSAVQCGIRDIDVVSFSDTEIVLSQALLEYEKKRVTYIFDGWTYVAEEKLVCDVANKLMYADGTLFDAGYQSSNPLNAFSDIAKIVRIWNKDTGVELTDWKVEGRTISTSQTIEDGKMYAEYYYSDLTQVINTDLVTRNQNESWTHELTSGETKLAFFPFWDISRGDIIVIAATVVYKQEVFIHLRNIDKLHEIEIFELNDIIIDEEGNTYYLDTDYILQGRHVKWIGTEPKKNAVCSVRYGYKPAFIVFEDNPQPNNLENKIYPKMVLVKSWSKVGKDDIAKLLGDSS